MPIHNDSQQQQSLHRRSWSSISKRIHNEKMGPGMKIIGKVMGSVDLNDIGRVVAYNQIVDINEMEVNNSKKLHHALKMGWIEIIEDRGLLRRALILQGKPQEIKEEKQDLMEIAKEMAKTMAIEMLKNNDAVKELKQELTKEIRDLKGSIVIQQLPQIESEKEKVFIEEKEKPEDIFVDLDGQETIKHNIVEVGTIKEEKEDLSDSIAKMKKFRRKPLRDSNGNVISQ